MELTTLLSIVVTTGWNDTTLPFTEYSAALNDTLATGWNDTSVPFTESSAALNDTPATGWNDTSLPFTESSAALNNTLTALNDSTTSFTMSSDGDMLKCANTLEPCTDAFNFKHYCLHEGLCCVNKRLDAISCICLEPFSGTRCETINLSNDYEFSSSGRTQTFISITAVISLLIALIVLIALVVIVVLIFRKKLTLRRTDYGLEHNLIETEEEISQMSTIDKLKCLTKLSKKFEASARAVIEDALNNATLSSGVDPAAKHRQALSPLANSCLPRWSSAPTCLQVNENAIVGEDAPDSGPNNGVAKKSDNSIEMTVIERHQLQKVFSVPL